MRRSYKKDERKIRFEVIDEVLVRTVILPDGRQYTHRCEAETFREVAYAVERQGTQGFTMEQLAEQLDLPSTQVNVALELLKDRMCVVTRRRRNYAAADYQYEDALIEFHTIKDGVGPN